MRLRMILRSKYGGLGLFALALALLPLLTTNGYYLGVINQIGIYSIVALGLSLLIGYAGQISFGHAAFYGIGAYTSGILSVKMGISPWLGLVAGGILAGLVALVIGIPTLRLKHHFLALATLGFAIIIKVFFIQWEGLTNGPSGLSLPYFNLGGYSFTGEIAPYYLIWFFVVLSMGLAKNLVASRLGLGLRAIKGSEVAAKSMGIDASRSKLIVFVFSAVLAGIAGALYAHYISFISPGSFEIMLSVMFVVIAVAGGPESIWGAVIGSTLVTVLTEGLKVVVPLVVPSAGGKYEVVMYGLLMMIVLIFMPQGVTSIFKKIGRQKSSGSTYRAGDRGADKGGELG